MAGEPQCGWRAILSGAAADRAFTAIDLIAESIARQSSGERDYSLAGGQAGFALLYAMLARARGDTEAAVLARRCLDRAVETVATEGTETSFWHGFPGVAWASDLLGRLLDDPDEEGNDDVDAVVAEIVARPGLWPSLNDLVFGLTGAGVYALERLQRPAAVLALRRIVQHLDDTARYDEDGVYWWRPSDTLPADIQDGYPDGVADLGVAHGVGGAIAFLGALCAAGIEEVTAHRLLEGAVNWLRTQAIPAESGPTFPPFVAPEAAPQPARTAWCYGDAGIAAALLVAARGAGEPTWEKEAIALACRASERPDDDTQVEYAGFCHGAAGLAHIYNRMYQATGEPQLERAARHWVERTLEFWRDDTAERDRLRAAGDEDVWLGIELLEGEAGTALVLLAAATDVEPIWDRMFLVSARPVPLLADR